MDRCLWANVRDSAGTRRQTAQAHSAQVAQAVQEQAADIALLAKAQMEDKKGVPGTVKGLGKEQEDLVLLARGCD